MNTINKLQHNSQSAVFSSLTTDSESKCFRIKTLADLGIVLPQLSRRDKAKVKQYLTALRSAIQSAEYHLANTSHKVRSSGDWVNKDRLGAVTNAIAKLGKLNPAVLQGGLPVKTALLDCGWMVYAKLEVHGLDNAHYQQTDIPCAVDGEIGEDDSTQGFRNRWYKHELAS